MRPCFNWVRASAEPSVPTNFTGLPAQFLSLQAAISLGKLVRRLAPTFLPQSAAHVLELGGAGGLHEELRAALHVVDEGRGLVPGGVVGHAGHDGVDPAGGDRGHHLVEAGFLPDDLMPSLLAERLAEFDVEAGELAGGRVLELQRRVVRHDRDLEAVLDDRRAAVRRAGRSVAAGRTGRRQKGASWVYLSSLWLGCSAFLLIYLDDAASCSRRHPITADRKACVRASRGEPSTCEGGPSSTIAPWSM